MYRTGAIALGVLLALLGLGPVAEAQFAFPPENTVRFQVSGTYQQPLTTVNFTTGLSTSLSSGVLTMTAAGFGNNSPAVQSDSWTSDGTAHVIATYTFGSAEVSEVQANLIVKRSTGGTGVYGAFTNSVGRTASGTMQNFSTQTWASKNTGGGTPFSPTLTVTYSGLVMQVKITTTANDVCTAKTIMAVVKNP